MTTTIIKFSMVILLSLGLFNSCKPDPQKSIAMKTSLDSLQYYQGLYIGIKLREAGFKNFDDKLFNKAIDDFKVGNLEPSSVYEEAQSYVSELIAEQNYLRQINEMRLLEENKKKPGVTTTPSGLQYKIVKQGKGNNPKIDDIINIKMVGKRADGIVFVKRTGETEFTGRIACLAEGVQLMKKGAKYIFYAPPNLTYGPNPTFADGEHVRPNMVAIYEIELVDVKPKKK